MTISCIDLVRFADGELDAPDADAFREHLRTCDACQAGLVEAMVLSARLSLLPPMPEPGELALRSVDGPVDVPAAKRELRAEPGRPTLVPPRKPGHGTRNAVTMLGAFAAAIAIYLAWPSPAPDLFASVQTRTLDVRFVYPGAARHRPLREAMRGDGRRSDAGELSFEALGTLEKRGDRYGLAIAQAWKRQDLEAVSQQLRVLAPTPPIRADFAAVEVLRVSPDNADPVLAELERLRRDGNPAIAHAAQWNYAVLLSRLGLSLSAARAFREVAAAGEPGWAREARDRADREDAIGKAFRERWQRASTQTQALVATGEPLPPSTVQAFPGLVRASLYDAVRAAPTADRVRALLPVAAALDGSGASTLRDYVQRVAQADFARRAPLAQAYAQLLAGAPVPTDAMAALTARAPDDAVGDIVLGTMLRPGSDVDRDALDRLVQRSGDPWFEIAGARVDAQLDAMSDDWLAAERELRRAEQRCSNELAYQCLHLKNQLARLYLGLHRVHDALAVARDGFHTARTLGEWGRAGPLLWDVGEAARFNESIAASRAYIGELLLTAPDFRDYQSAGHLTLAGAALLDVDGAAARRHLDAALAYGPPDVPAANYLSDIGRLDPLPDDLTRLQGWLANLRANPALRPGDRVLLDEIEGRLRIEHDRDGGAQLLERAITAAGEVPHDVTADKARAGAYSVLVFDAAQRGDDARVVALIAEDLGVARPDRCAAALVVEDERGVAVVRGADGRDRARYSPRRARDTSPAVPDDLARTLDGCSHVQVLASARLQGQPGVLPAALAWSYTTGAHRRAIGPAAGAPAPSAPHPLIIADVRPPDYLHLPPLQAGSHAGPQATTLEGPDATPARVIAAMQDADEIQFHTHARMDVGVSDASHLVLSPAPDGHYALTAEAIRTIELRARPVVVLAACESATGARYQHAPWSLPDAFLQAGARAVFAAATAIPDREAGPFFDRVLQSVRAGADPAIALRDARMAMPALPASGWTGSVVLFE